MGQIGSAHDVTPRTCLLGTRRPLCNHDLYLPDPDVRVRVGADLCQAQVRHRLGTCYSITSLDLSQLLVDYDHSVCTLHTSLLTHTGFYFFFIQ
jgi:hypothetical protein